MIKLETNIVHLRGGCSCNCIVVYLQIYAKTHTDTKKVNKNIIPNFAR